MAAAALLSLAVSARAAPSERYEGRAYASGSNAFAYGETNWLFDDVVGVRTRLVLYRCANGAPFARKLVRDRGNDVAPDFDFVDARDGYTEGVHSEGGQRTVFVRQRAGDPLQQKTIDLGPDAVVDAGFDALIRQRWEHLTREGFLSGSFLVPGRLEFLPVKITRQPNGAHDGLLRMRLQLDRWYGFALPKMQITYREADLWLDEFEGISNIRDASLQRASVRIEFPESARSTAVSQEEIDTALHAQLTRSCG
jgi:hypothetical protein